MFSAQNPRKHAHTDHGTAPAAGYRITSMEWIA
jgi:hypothetical protein